MRSSNIRDCESAISGLRRRSAVKALRRLAKQRGIAVWIVGGAVRDRCLGLDVPEIDLAVERDAEVLARELEREGAGRAVDLSRDRPGPRVFRVAGPRPLDIAELEGGTIASDLGRRDFTVNAIAVALENGEIVDPFGGLRDLADRKLRCVRPENLMEDPLRALRAARFLATHELRPDGATLEAVRRAARELSRVAEERIGAELSKLLGSAAASPALSWAARAGLLPAALGIDRPPNRIAAASRALRVLDDASTRRLLPGQRRRLRLAFLAARLRLSPSETRRWLRHRRWASREAEDVARLVALEGSAPGIRDKRGTWRWILQAGPLAEEAMLLLGKLHPGQSRRASRIRRLARSPRRTIDVKGGDIVRWLGIPPGPQVGALLYELRVAAAAGEVKNRREARDWLSGQVRTSRPPAIISEH